MMEQRSSPEHPQHHQPKPAPSIAPFSCLAKLCVVCACMQTCACVCLPAAALHAALHMPIALLCSACMPQVCFACAGIKDPFLHASQGFLAGLGRVEAALLLSPLGSRNSPSSPADRPSGVQWALQELPAELGSQRRTSSFSATEPCLRQDLTAMVPAPSPAASVRRQQERPSMEARRRKLDTSALQVGLV